MRVSCSGGVSVERAEERIVSPCLGGIGWRWERRFRERIESGRGRAHTTLYFCRMTFVVLSLTLSRQRATTPPHGHGCLSLYRRQLAVAIAVRPPRTAVVDSSCAVFVRTRRYTSLCMLKVTRYGKTRPLALRPATLRSKTMCLCV